MRLPPLVLLVLLSLQVLDMLTTALGQFLGITEGNPVVRWLLGWGGYAGFAFAKVFFVLFASLLLNWSWRGAGPWALHVLNVIYVAIVVGNVGTLLHWPMVIAWIAAALFAVLWLLVPRGIVPALPARARFLGAEVQWAGYSDTTERSPSRMSPSYR